MNVDPLAGNLSSSIPPTMQSITFIGTGLMGLPMAQRLQSAGFPLTVWNRTRAKAVPLLNAGARWAETPADAARAANVVITILTNAPAVEEVLFKSGAAEQMRREAVVID